MMAGDLAGSRRATDFDPSLGAFNPEPAITAPPEAEDAGPERPVPPAAPDEDVLIPQSLEPLVPDEVVADLEDEPMWGTALKDDDGAAPDIFRLDGEADELDDEIELEPLRRAEDDLDEAFEDDLRLEPLPAAAADDDDLDDLDDLDEAMAPEPAPPATAAPDPLVLEDEPESEPEEAAGWDEEEVTAWRRVDASTDRRRPLMTADFDDVLPEEMSEEGDDAGKPSAADDRLVQQSRRRAPLKARRAGKGTGASEPAAPTRRSAAKKAPAPAKAAKPAAVKRVTTAKSAPRVTKAEPVRSPARPSPAPAKTTRKVTKAAPPAPVAKVAAPAKKVSTRRRRPDVLWVEPVGGACPTGYPVKASLSSGIFHVVGGLFYERSKPDRCYRTPAAAEGDGLRQAKR